MKPHPIDFFHSAGITGHDDLFPALGPQTHDPLIHEWHILSMEICHSTNIFCCLYTIPTFCRLLKNRYGRENYPLLLEEKEHRKKIWLFEFRVSPEAVSKTGNQIGLALEECGCMPQLINRTTVVFEGLFMLIYDRNPGKAVYAECAVEAGTCMVRLTAKDNGRILNLTDSDSRVTSLRTYVLFNMLDSHTALRIHSLALSYNHYALEIR